MKVIWNYPPNIEEIKKHFKVNRGTVYTYGDTIYNPFIGKLDSALMAHEETHMRQQGDDPKKWWDRYLIDTEFRVSQEAEAYHNQLNEFIKTAKVQEAVDEFLVKIAQDLSGPMYGNSISFNEAIEKITKDGDK